VLDKGGHGKPVEKRGGGVSPNAVDPRLTAPYRLYFWSNENVDTHKPAHVHVESSDGFAEFWLAPVRVKHPGSYNALQRARARRIVEQFEPECLDAWELMHGSR
jgi:hypothetical protein